MKDDTVDSPHRNIGEVIQFGRAQTMHSEFPDTQVEMNGETKGGQSKGRIPLVGCQLRSQGGARPPLGVYPMPRLVATQQTKGELRDGGSLPNRSCGRRWISSITRKAA